MNLNEVQKKVLDFCHNNGLNTKVEIRIVDLTSEVGELSKEVLKGSNYGEKAFAKTENWNDELGDVLFSLLCLANETQVDLEKCLDGVLKKYETRLKNRNDIGSGK